MNNNMASSGIPAKFTWFDVLNSQNYRLNSVPFDSTSSAAAVDTGYQPVFGISGNNVWDTGASRTQISSSGQATDNAFTQAPTVAMNLTNTGVGETEYVLWLRSGYDSEPGNLVPGNSSAGTRWTAPAGSDGFYSVTANMQGSAGVGIMVGQNYALTIKQNGYPVCQSTRLATGSAAPFQERTSCSTMIYIKAGEVITAELAAGYTNAPFTITNVVLTLTKVSGAVTGVTG